LDYRIGIWNPESNEGKKTHHHSFDDTPRLGVPSSQSALLLLLLLLLLLFSRRWSLSRKTNGEDAKVK
jgi:hypothetical protein